MTFKNHLQQIGACQEAREWAGDKTAKEAWETCERADWLLWWAARDGATKQGIVRAAIEIAKSVSHLTSNPKAPLAIQAAENWVNNPTKENRQLAYNTAREVWASDADAAAADVAAYAAAYAAAAASADADADGATDADAAAADVAAAAAYADAAADADASDVATEQRIKKANFVRQFIPQPWTETK